MSAPLVPSTFTPPQFAGPGRSRNAGARPRGRRRGAKPIVRRLLKGLDPIRLSAVVLIIVTLSAVHMHLGPLKYTRPGFVLLVLVAGLIAMKPKLVRWPNLTEAWPAIAIGAFVLLGIGSAFFGLSMGGALRFITDRYWKVLFFFVVLVVAIRHVKDLMIVVWGFVISIGIINVLSVSITEVTKTQEGLDRVGGQGMFDGNDIGMVILMGMPMAILMLFNSGRIGRMMAIFTLLGTPVTVALTGSRGAMVGLGVMALPLFFALGRIALAKRMGGVVALLVALAIAAPDGYWAQMGTTFNPETNYNFNTDYGRLSIAKRGVGYMLRYPLFGVGMANFSRAEGTISELAERRARAGLSVPWIAPHNTYVQVGAEMGLPALLLWLGMLWAGTMGLLKLRKKLPRAWEQQSGERRFLRDATLFLPISYLGFASTSFFLTHAYTPPFYILLAITAGVVALAQKELAADKAALRASGMVPARGRQVTPVGRASAFTNRLPASGA